MSSISVRRALSSQTALLDHGEYCSAHPRLLGALGIEPGGQLRLRRSSDEYATYTVFESRHEPQPEIVRLGEAGRERLGTTETFQASTSTPVPASDISDREAERDGELVERLTDPGGDGLVVSAPHGGWIERYTDRQAERVAERLAGVTSWYSKGWRHGGGAYERWHVSSTNIHPDSFPFLASIADRGFQYSASFHGFDGEGILVGGGASERLKREVRAAIETRIDGDIDVRLATSDRYDGDSPANLVNWLAATERGGVQIEQGFASREDYWRPVADAVASVFEPKL